MNLLLRELPCNCDCGWAVETCGVCSSTDSALIEQIGMEMWARWAHKALWHDLAAGWSLHESHHKQRIGAFEANDVFAVVNAVPAIALCAYGFFSPTIMGGVAFGSGKTSLCCLPFLDLALLPGHQSPLKPHNRNSRQSLRRNADSDFNLHLINVNSHDSPLSVYFMHDIQ